eukprot:TRINITY_DN6735_c0_g1_i1.p1 TRINITY_DN6735_c0_g1~~TRINITY_DN6735_c0_g1_i1.p1  ORF type:complete len:322 (+),score=31.93 TRINITY_DN6735_c0_g1_i1:44-967(+)
MATSADPAWTKFVYGGVSCMAAACVTNPIDVVKTRLQLQGELTKRNPSEPLRYRGFIQGGVQVVRDEGIMGLYKGLFPSILREASYSTLRMGGYDVIKEMLGGYDARSTPLWVKITAGATSGAIGAAICSPTDLVKVRMQAQGVPGKASAYHYPSTLSAFGIIYKGEGVRGLYKGVVPTTQRAAILTATQLASYDHIKQAVLAAGVLGTDGPLIHFAASTCAGFIAAATTSPVDVVKTRVMNQPLGPAGVGLLYANSWDCVLKTIRSEGFMGLYKGFIPNWLRIGPHTIVTFLVYEQLRRMAGLKPI